MVPVEHIFIEEIKKAEEQFNFFRTVSIHVLSDLPVKKWLRHLDSNQGPSG